MSEFIAEAEQTKLDLGCAKETIDRQLKANENYKKMEEKGKGLEEQRRAQEAIDESLTERTLAREERERAFGRGLCKANLAHLNDNKSDRMGRVGKVFGHPGVTVTRDVPGDMGFTKPDGSYSNGASLMQAKETTTESKG